jgi:hypothetical protein
VLLEDCEPACSDRLCPPHASHLLSCSASFWVPRHIARPANLLGRLENGGVLIVMRRDRLARSMRGLTNGLGAVSKHGAGSAY